MGGKCSQDEEARVANVAQPLGFDHGLPATWDRQRPSFRHFIHGFLDAYMYRMQSKDVMPSSKDPKTFRPVCTIGFKNFWLSAWQND